MGDSQMNQNPSEALGALLRQKREELGYSKNQLARAAGVRDSTVLRFEAGRFVAPRPDKLARFAQLLGLSLADLYAQAGYIVPDELPGFGAYLLAKYPDLPSAAITELRDRFDELMARHDIEIEPPLPAFEELLDEGVGETA